MQALSPSELPLRTGGPGPRRPHCHVHLPVRLTCIPCSHAEQPGGVCVCLCSFARASGTDRVWAMQWHTDAPCKILACVLWRTVWHGATLRRYSIISIRMARCKQSKFACEPIKFARGPGLCLRAWLHACRHPESEESNIIAQGCGLRNARDTAVRGGWLPRASAYGAPVYWPC